MRPTIDIGAYHHTGREATRQMTILSAIVAIPTSDANFARKRTQMAIYLVTTASQYQVQR